MDYIAVITIEQKHTLQTGVTDSIVMQNVHFYASHSMVYMQLLRCPLYLNVIADTIFSPENIKPRWIDFYYIKSAESVKVPFLLWEAVVKIQS